MQAEAPPGLLLSQFKRLIRSGGITSADVAFYFVHWLTDLSAAEGSPLSGAEKFVVNFPHDVLQSFISSFPIVQQLATLSEVELMQRFLEERWPTYLGDLPTGPHAIALMRLVQQVQSPEAQHAMVAAFDCLPEGDKSTLAFEMALTGIYGQTYSHSFASGGPAFLVRVSEGE